MEKQSESVKGNPTGWVWWVRCTRAVQRVGSGGFGALGQSKGLGLVGSVHYQILHDEASICKCKCKRIPS